MSAFEYWKEKKAWSDDDAFYDVDYVLTTRELARMFKETGIRFAKLPPEEFDSPLGESTGAAVIFGATGGVMEAALTNGVRGRHGQNPRRHQLYCRQRNGRNQGSRG